MITAVPRIVFGGGTMASSYDKTYHVMSMGSFSIDYGRDSTTAQPTPSRLRASFLSSIDDSRMVQSPVDYFVEVWVKIGSLDQRIFRGKVRAGSVTYVGRFDGIRRFRVELEATDPLTELGWYYYSTTNNDFAEETAVSRLERFSRFMGNFVSGIGGGGGTVNRLAPRPLNRTVLEEVTAVFNVGAEALGYDPMTNRIEALGRPDVIDPALSLKPSYPGKYGLSVRATDTQVAMAHMGAHQVTATDSMKFQADQRVKTVEVVCDIKDDTVPPTKWIKGASYLTQMGVGGSSTFTMDLDTYWYQIGNSITNNGAAEAGGKWQRIMLDARDPTHPPIRTRHESGFLSEADALAILGCVELRRGTYVSGSPYNSLRKNKPLIVRVIGGTITYDAGTPESVDGEGTPPAWETERVFANMPLNDVTIAPLTWKTIKPAAGKNLRWSDLDETVTWESARYLTQGI